MENQPTTPTPAPAVSSGLATASMVCGICTLLLGPLTGIPAIITGHMALGKIKKSGGLLKGSGMATAGLIMGYLSLLFLVLAIAAGNAMMNKARKLTAMNMAMQIESAVNSFYVDYGAMPNSGSSDVTIQTDEDTTFLAILLGTETEVNTRAIKFLALPEAKGKKNGIAYGADGTSVLGVYDPWGGAFKVRLDLDQDETLVVNPGSGGTVQGKRVAVWSDGADRKPGTEDDVKTW